jgi:hypothetical protein
MPSIGSMTPRKQENRQHAATKQQAHEAGGGTTLMQGGGVGNGFELAQGRVEANMQGATGRYLTPALNDEIRRIVTVKREALRRRAA